jgi:hypothetical protein
MFEPRRPMPARVAVAFVAALLAVAALPAGPAHASTKPPVVSVRLDDSGVKVSGAKGLKAGWVTLHISEQTPGELDVILSMDRHPSGKSDAGPAPAPTIRRSAPHSAAPAGSAPTPETYAQDARSARDGEKAIDWMGGINVADSRGVDLTVKLPAGTLFVEMGISGSAVIKVGKGTNSSAPGHATASVREGKDSVIHAPSTLPRSGVLRISDTDSGVRAHYLMLVKPPKGATKKSIEKSFAKDPYSATTKFGSYPVTGYFNPLSAGHTEYQSYRNLKPGRYAFIDTATDDRTGHVHARDGAITFVTVK